MTARIFNDDPGSSSPMLTSDYTLAFTGNYYLYIFYKAVDDTAGASVYVPIVYIPWNAIGQFSLTVPNTWTQRDTGSGYAKGGGTYPPLSLWPQW